MAMAMLLLSAAVARGHGRGGRRTPAAAHAAADAAGHDTELGSAGVAEGGRRARDRRGRWA